MMGPDPWNIPGMVAAEMEPAALEVREPAVRCVSASSLATLSTSAAETRSESDRLRLSQESDPSTVSRCLSGEAWARPDTSLMSPAGAPSCTLSLVAEMRSVLSELGGGAVARAFQHREIDALALRLLRGHCVFSRSWKTDLWLHLKNKQIVLSIFLVHRRHPFNRRERRWLFAVSCLLGWAMEAWFCALRRPEICPGAQLNLNSIVWLWTHVIGYKIVFCAVSNGLYDVVLEQAMTCGCVQEGCPVCVRKGCEMLSVIQCLVQATFATALLFLGARKIVELNEGQSMWRLLGDIGISVRELLLGKFFGLFVVTLLVEVLGFFLGRRAQMKPEARDLEGRRVWDQRKRGYCCGLCPKRQKPSHLWDKFIGVELEYEDLPPYAPTYDVELRLCGRVLYAERADMPLGIPRCFRGGMEDHAMYGKRGKRHAWPDAEAVETDRLSRVSTSLVSTVTVFGPSSGAAAAWTVEDSAPPEAAPEMERMEPKPKASGSGRSPRPPDTA